MTRTQAKSRKLKIMLHFAVQNWKVRYCWFFLKPTGAETLLTISKHGLFASKNLFTYDRSKTRNTISHCHKFSWHYETKNNDQRFPTISCTCKTRLLNITTTKSKKHASSNLKFSNMNTIPLNNQLLQKLGTKSAVYYGTCI